MWAIYDYSKFPVVYVKFNKHIKNENEFNQFLKEWILLYQNKKEFTFIFDTTKVSPPNIKYCRKMTRFIKKIKRFPKQYLQKSTIIISNNYIKYLLKFIFTIQKPVAPVHYKII